MPNLLELKKDSNDHFSLGLKQDALKQELEKSLKQCQESCFLDTEQSIELERGRKNEGATKVRQGYLKNAYHVTDKLLKCKSLEGEDFKEIHSQIKRVNTISLECLSQKEMMTAPEGMVETQSSPLMQSQTNTQENEKEITLTHSTKG